MGTCAHPAPRVASACAHVLTGDAAFYTRFLGRAVDHELLCTECATAARALPPGAPSADTTELCQACAVTAREGGMSGIDGAPEIRIAPPDPTLRFVHVRTDPGSVLPRFVEAAPILGGDRARFLAIADDGALWDWDLDRNTAHALASRVPFDAGIDLAQPIMLKLSPDGRLAAMANRRGVRGAIVDVATGDVVRPLERDGYHAEHCDYSLAMIHRNGRDLAIHAPDWNRLDVIDARTGELLTTRGPTSYQSGDERPAHYLDYFHCALEVSPTDEYIADSGWVWQPIGGIATWNLARWLDDNPWESEDGPSKHTQCWRYYYWDGPMCWLDSHTLAVYGYGEDDEHLIPAARIFDARTGNETSWFPGPSGKFVAHDGLLVTHDPATGHAAWDVARGERLVADDATRQRIVRYHPSARVFASLGAPGLGPIASRLCGRDRAAPWCDPAVVELAASIARDGSFDELPVLGDALERAGCTDREMLAHCQHPGEHAGTRCWALDRLI